jgi:lipopolysaccharide/colanic/teichoic acid biosynthesis glycosyltransferase
MSAAYQMSDSRALRHTSTNDLSKRCLDLVLGSILSLLVLPAVLIFAVEIAISMRCWPFFSHTRPGRDGTPIRMLKLRTLPPSTPTYADKRDLRIDDMPLPLLCRVLRRTHLDELPQLFLVVSGKMSLVGPRPGQDPRLERFDRDFNTRRTSVRPGCTGLWQIGVGSQGAIAESPHFDLFYLNHVSLRLDMWIVLRTVPWLFGLVKPIDLADVPRWLLGGSHTVMTIPDAVASDGSPPKPTSRGDFIVYPSDTPGQRAPISEARLATAD